MVLFVDNVGVVGAGTMGAQIAEVFALNGKKVVLNDLKQDFVDKGLKAVRQSLDGLAAFHAGKADREIARVERELGVTLTDGQKQAAGARMRPTYTQARVDEAYGRIEGTTQLESLKDCDLVIEAIVEKAQAKADLFARLGKVVQPRAVFATNTSALPVSPMAKASGRPERFVGTHFFNPPTTLPLVEIIRADQTSDETASDVMNVLAQMRNHRYPLMPIPVKECPGFLVNRVLGAMLEEAYRCYEEKVASARDIDNAMKAGAGMPMGPLELTDLIGLDVIAHVRASVASLMASYGQYIEKPTVVEDLVGEGRLGRKTGKGFFEYA